MSNRLDISDVQLYIRQLCGEIHNPRNDGWTSRTCKHQLFQLKCLLDDAYKQLPYFVGEEQWEQERLIEVLKR